MKKKLYLLFAVAFVLFINTASARLFRIGFTGTPVTGVDYTYNNMSGAITAASAGDTMQLYQQYWPGNTSTVSINKRLVFIGFGYFLDKNPNLQALSSPDNYAAGLYFQTGSEGSIMQGIFGNAYVNVSNIKINRCRLNNLYIYNNVALSDVSITQCFIGQIYEYYAQKVTNLVIKNSYLGYVYLPNSSGIFTNNVVGENFYNTTLYSFLIRNNIFYGCISVSANIIQNNLFSQTCAVGAGTNNKQAVDLDSVFVNWNSGSIAADSQLVIRAGGPASNAGVKNDNTATDAGMFGGETGESYRLSGIPAVPSIYKLTAPSQTANTSPYVITVSIRSNN